MRGDGLLKGIMILPLAGLILFAALFGDSNEVSRTITHVMDAIWPGNGPGSWNPFTR